MQNNSIHCKVDQCRYNDRTHYCTLSDITVGCSCSSPHEKCETECDSFEEK